MLRSSVVLACCLCLMPLVGWAQINDKTSKYKMLSTQVLVLDDKGNPVEGAEVSCTGLRVKQNPGSHYMPPTDLEWPKLKTDAQGIVTVAYPQSIGKDLDVSIITWTVEHPEFVAFREDRPVDAQPAEIKLARGYKIAVSAVDGTTREPIKQNLFGMVADGSGNWKQFENGMLVSPTLNRQNAWFRLVQIVDGQATAFSDFLEAKPEDKSRVIFKDVEMKPTVKVRGKLADDVPRPISAGRVSLIIFDKAQAEDNDLRWYWFDYAEINADGTFEFNAVPRNNVIQLIAVCDHWIPRQPPAELVKALFAKEQQMDPSLSYPTPFVVQEEDLEIELAMDPGKTIRVKAVDESDAPVAGVSFGVWPNQYLFNGGTQILGEGLRYAEALTGPKELRRGQAYKRYVAETDATGIALIKSVPPKYDMGIEVMSEGYEVVDQGQDGVAFRLAESETTEITIRVKKTK